MERMNAYATPADNGGVRFDVEGMAVDLITIMKAGGHTKEQFLELIGSTWDDVQVTIDTTNVKKDS